MRQAGRAGRFFGLLAAAAGLLGLLATAEAALVRDMLGRPLQLPDRPLRVVSLAPSLTEIVYVLGRDGWLAGVTDFCDFPPAARTKPRIGGQATPSLERILSLGPDLVLTTAEGNARALLEQLERLRVPTLAVKPDTFDGVLESVRTIGRALRTEAAAEALAGELQARGREVAARVAGRDRPRVLYLVWGDPLIAAGPATYIHDLLGMAGGENVVRERTVPYPRLGWEEVVGRQPAVILLASHRDEPDPVGSGPRPVPEIFRPWRAIPAVRAGRVIPVSSDSILRPGPRLGEGLLRLARAMHPEAFAARGGPDPGARPVGN